MASFEGEPRAPAGARFAILATRWNPGITDPMLAAATGAYVALVALGCVVRGDTRHYEHVADECARGLMRVALDHGIPVANGVLAVELYEDARARAGGVHGNKGEEAALAALEMASLAARFPSLLSEETA